MGLKLQVRQNARYERNIEATITFINGSASFNSFKFCLIDFLKFIIVGFNVQKNAHFSPQNTLWRNWPPGDHRRAPHSK